MTDMVTELDMTEAENGENCRKTRETYIVPDDEGSTLPKVPSEKEPVGKQSMTEERLQPAGDNYQELSSDCIEESTEGLLAEGRDKHTNSVDHPLSLQQVEEQNQLHDNVESNETLSNSTSSGTDSDSSSGSDSDSESGKYSYPKIELLETAKQPEPGMKFQTLDDAHGFYNAYALLKGFEAKRGTNYMRKKFHLICNRNGKPRATQDLIRKRKRKSIEKTNCQAKVIVKLIKGQWEFTTVRNEHNHPLCPSASLTKFFLSHKHISAEERSFLKILQRTRIPPTKVMKIFRRMRGSSGNIPFKKKDPTNSLCAEQHRKENSDVERTLMYLKELELQILGFRYTKQITGDNIVRSILWTDERSRIDYEIFGDFLSFDTTYTTEWHNMPFAPIIGRDNHGRTLFFGCALLHDENAETYKWMLQTLLHVMGGKMPVSIITNQDEALAKAIADVMPQVRHRFYKWDVIGKAQERTAAFMAERGNIKAELNNLVDNSLTETEFEEGWGALMQRYNASENDYLQLMWQTRKNWVPVYFRQDFYPFVLSHGRGEGMNLLFKDYVLPNDRIDKFIERYEEIRKKILTTADEDRLQTGTVPSCFSLQPIEKHAANIYTRQIFLKVQRELLHSTAFNMQEVQKGAVYCLNKVFNYENPEFDRNNFKVVVESGTNAFKCQCAKFTRDGILCCHIFRLFTQFGINEIPGQYIVPRWTYKFKEEKTKEYKERCLEKTDTTTRYATFMSKMADLGKKVCSDAAKYEAFMLELDKIQENFAMEGENPKNNGS
uniref:Uncharacterized protein n=1 Tax=Avena sativa TaxID=4498 RepID=A0ACD5YQK5_AVESA